MALIRRALLRLLEAPLRRMELDVLFGPPGRTLGFQCLGLWMLCLRLWDLKDFGPGRSSLADIGIIRSSFRVYDDQ